ncbi:hypothetical protein BRC71_03410 [Halobacteriales archaeon QH_7_65_31]|nr:MAG: hypothetical protein BRC71_03410 [Halobacteriales archaeon QH_7_65_31]
MAVTPPTGRTYPIRPGTSDDGRCAQRASRLAVRARHADGTVRLRDPHAAGYEALHFRHRTRLRDRRARLPRTVLDGRLARDDETSRRRARDHGRRRRDSDGDGHAPVPAAAGVSDDRRGRRPLALAVAVSRVYLGTHYLSDTVAGIAIGIGAVAITGALLPRWEPPSSR